MIWLFYPQLFNSVLTLIDTLRDHHEWVNAVAWSPNGDLLATGAEDNTVKIWDTQSNRSLNSPSVTKLALRSKSTTLLRTLAGHTYWITDVAWSPDGQLLASAGDQTIRIWDPQTGTQLYILEGHKDRVKSVSFSADGKLLASKSEDNTIRLWRCDQWTPVAIINESTVKEVNPESTIAFHPNEHILATLGENDKVIRIWEIDFHELIHNQAASFVHYVNAKVVLVGDSGVGKTGLGIRLAENRFYNTMSTHGAQFWQIPIPQQKIEKVLNLPYIKAELTLWDFAGQPEYRLVHQLFLDDVDVALLLFDCSDALDPFRGVAYWAKTLGQTPSHARKLLISSRSDVSPPTVDRNQINQIIAKFGLYDYIRTSALTGEGVAILFERIVECILWSALPRTTTPQLFQLTRELLLEYKQKGIKLVPIEAIENDIKDRFAERPNIRSEIKAVVKLLQAQGIVQELQPSPQLIVVLLQPELVNQYAASIIHAARSNEQGTGSVLERDVLIAKLPLTGVARLSLIDEKIVLESTVELLIKHELCFREMGMLVFPSQINNVNSTFDGKANRAEITYRFSGGIEIIYASLVVRLSYTNYFKLVNLSKYAAEFERDGKFLSFFVKQAEEGTGDLDICFDTGIHEFDKITFVRFITDHLFQKGINIEERIRLYCPACGNEVTNRDAINIRIQSNKFDIPCQYCGDNVILPRSIEERYQQDRAFFQKQQQLKAIVNKRVELEISQFKAEQQTLSLQAQDMFQKYAILIIFANPRGSNQLRLSAEDRVIRESLRFGRYGDRIDIDILHAATVHDVRRALLNKNYRVVQFSGHGTGQGLAFENDFGEVHLVSKEALAEFMSAYSPPIECVILNACFSSMPNDTISLSIPFTITMNGPISDDSSKEFTRGFYDAIGAGKSIEYAYQEGCRTIRLMGLPDSDKPSISKQ